MKKWFALLLVLVLCVPCMTVCAEESKPEEYTSGDWKYILLEDGTADIINFANRKATSVEIPEEIDGHPVTISRMNPFSTCVNPSVFSVSPNHPSIATIDGVLFNKAEKKLVAFPAASEMTEYVIPEGILAVGNYAFSCSLLKSIKLPESVTSIGDSAFSACASLTSITLPDRVTGIGKGAFFYCKSLNEICVSSENSAFSVIDGVLFDKSGESLIAFPVGNSRTEYKVPDGVVNIAGGAFGTCKKLTTITLPESVTSIGESAFKYCKSLTSIKLPESVTNIGERAFAQCKSLEAVHVAPDSYAEAYCKDNDLPIAYIENTDWLNG